MEATTAGNITSHVTKGFILAVILIIYSITGHLANLFKYDWFVMEGVGIFVAGVIWGVINHAGQMKGNVTFQTLLVHGLRLTAVFTCLYFVYTLLEVYVLFPHYLDGLVKEMALRTANAGKIDQDKFDENKNEARKVLATMRFAGMVMGPMIIGLLATMLGGVLAKKNPQASTVQQ